MTPDAKEQTRQKLLTLQSTQSVIEDEIIHRYGTIKQKLNQLADIMAERIELLDPLMEGIGLQDISAQISRVLKEKGCPIAPWVRDYLPSKYKNANMVRIDENISKINEICAELPRNLPEDCSNTELEKFYEINEEEGNQLDTAKSKNLKVKEKLESIALERGLQLGGYKFRRPISHTDFDEDIPVELIPYIEKNVERFDDLSEIVGRVGEKYKKDPPRVLQELLEDGTVLDGEIFKWRGHGGDYKATGDIDHSMERQYVSDLHGKHAAGNSDQFSTKLCKFCSPSEDTYNPDDFEVMKFCHDSPTNYKCAKCGGTEVIERGMSREQVGDRAAFIIRQAQNIIASNPLYGITLHRWITKYVQPKEDSRKTVIAQFFADSSMSGTSYKVVRKV